MQEALERIKKVKCFLFDMDGTINLGNELIPGMEGFFERLAACGRSFYLLTNNSSRSHEHYVSKMRGMGVKVEKENVLISTDALISFLAREKPGASLFVLGTAQLLGNIREAGFKLTESLEEETDYVVVGFDQELTYKRLAIACRLIDRGVPYLATHPDVRCPIEGGEFIPDTGAMLELIKTATGKDVSLIFGKPYKHMVDVVLERTGYSKDEIAMVGDRLSTDIAFGLHNGILSIMVLTGEATLEDVTRGNIKPDIILTCASDILDLL